MTRKEKANEKYSRLFEDRGLNKNFDYIEFENHDSMIVRCRTCGTTMSKSLDVFKGRQSRIICSVCRTDSNGKKTGRVHKYKSNHESVVEAGRIANRHRIEKTEVVAMFNAAIMGKKIIEPWEGRRKNYTVVDIATGKIETHHGSYFFPSRFVEKRAKRVVKIIDKGITITKLIDRDGPRCYLCGKETTFEDTRWGKYGPDYPTIDHVVPLAKGGAHTWENVKVCCGYCNTRKGAKV